MAKISFFLTISAFLITNEVEVWPNEAAYPYATFYIVVGNPFPTGSEKFFESYNEIIGGLENDFSMSANIGAGLKVQFSEGYRFGLTFDRNKAQLHEVFEQNIGPGETYTREIEEDLQIDNIAAFFVIEKIPFSGQFRTYIGIGAGALVGSIYWRELIYSDYSSDKRNGGLHYDEMNIAPAIRIYAGLELGFDKRGKEGFISAAMIEPRITYSFRPVRILQEAGREIEGAQPYWNEKIPLLQAYIGLNIGLTFNFNKVS